MLRHIVCIKLKAPELLTSCIDSSQVLATIPTVKNFLACPLLKQDLFHCALYMEFASESDLLAYQEHPVHRKFLNEVLPLYECGKIVVDLQQS
ncbi:MAG: Dabb family protein [Acidobacteria bacterium]|nr:Dabb family protein [Nitrospiraceae bacterium]MCI0621902.1 Dabb family protein [Acidobacteriota bacterium]MCI0717436.1 Dabb family protein [Acidobacteriota bacterium]